MLTVKQAAVVACVSPSLVYQWATAEKRFPVYRPGGKGRRGRILIDEGEFAAFLETLKVPAEGGAPCPN